MESNFSILINILIIPFCCSNSNESENEHADQTELDSQRNQRNKKENQFCLCLNTCLDEDCLDCCCGSVGCCEGDDCCFECGDCGCFDFCNSD